MKEGEKADDKRGEAAADSLSHEEVVVTRNMLHLLGLVNMLVIIFCGSIDRQRMGRSHANSYVK